MIEVVEAVSVVVEPATTTFYGPIPILSPREFLDRTDYRSAATDGQDHHSPHGSRAASSGM